MLSCCWKTSSQSILCLSVSILLYFLLLIFTLKLSLLEQMTNANVILENTVNTVIENTVNNQRKQNNHLGIKEDLHSLFGHIWECITVTSKT